MDEWKHGRSGDYAKNLSWMAPIADVPGDILTIWFCDYGDGNKAVATYTDMKWPAKVTLKSVKGKKKKLVVTWKKVSKNCKGYQLQCSKKKSFKSRYLTVNTRFSATTKRVIVTGLAKGNKRYVRVRAYNYNNGTYKYGKWSKIKSAKAK